MESNIILVCTREREAFMPAIIKKFGVYFFNFSLHQKIINAHRKNQIIEYTSELVLQFNCVNKTENEVIARDCMPILMLDSISIWKNCGIILFLSTTTWNLEYSTSAYRMAGNHTDHSSSTNNLLQVDYMKKFGK